MLFQTELWKLLAGVTFFLLGMNFLETSLKQLAGRSFKLFLKKHTTSKVKAIGGGAIVTGVLQSSSLVNLMVLAFVGAGVINMQNALAVILGANFGTTLDSWVVATLGFKFSIESFAYPLTGVAGIFFMLLKKENRWRHWSGFLLGFGLLFIGLDFMKKGMMGMVTQIDLKSFNQYPAVVFFVAGFFITSLIQSSSATVAIVLSALYANAISLYAATAIVLGSEIGTSVKLLLASVSGMPAKKRVALGNILFNLISTLLVFIFLKQINELITGVLGIGDKLIALVLFQSLVNIIGIILFYPFLDFFSGFLEKRFTKGEEGTSFINKTTVTDSGLAIEALENETLYFIHHVIYFGLDCFDRADDKVPGSILKQSFLNKTINQKYDYIKHLHGDIHSFYIQLQKTPQIKEDTERIDQLISCVRNCMYAAKSINDGYRDATILKNSANDIKYNFYLLFKKKTADLYSRLAVLLQQKETATHLDELTNLYKTVTENYTLTLQELYKESMAAHVNEIEISTLINFNREMVTSYKSIIFGIKDYLLTVKEAAYFDELPGFIR
jgi:phosphate:Na+ symporter